MKSYLNKTLLSLIVAGLAFGVTSDKKGDKNKARKKTLVTKAYIKGNNVEGMLSNQGSLFYDGSNAGFHYPAVPFSSNEYDLISNNAASVVYASGLWVGGKIDGQPKLAAAEYGFDYAPGEILSVANDASLTPTFTKETDSKYRMYYYFSDRHIEFLNRLKSEPDLTTNGKIHKFASEQLALAENHRAEWAEAVNQGAPAVPPGDVAVFCVYHDADDDKHSASGNGTQRMNIQVRQLTWLFRQEGSAVNNAIFVKFDFINKNPKPIEDMYATVWCDADIGDYNDDYVGSDPELGLGYCYNGNPSDNNYTGVLGVAPPAVGYDFFQGALIDSIGNTVIERGGDHFKVYFNKESSYVAAAGDKEITDKYVLPASSFVYYNNNSNDDGDPNTGAEMYNYMQVKTRSGAEFPAQKAALDAGLTTPDKANFFYNGDPYIGSGWIETVAPSDRRFMLNCGPFTLGVYNDKNGNGKADAGDDGYNEVVFGAFASIGGSFKSSVSRLKFDDRAIQDAFNKAFNLTPNPPAPIVTVRPYSITDDKGIETASISLNWQPGNTSFIDIAGNTITVSSENYKVDGYVEEGYELVQFKQDPAVNENDYKVIGTFDRYGNGVTSIIQQVYDEAEGAPLEKTVVKGADNGVRNDFIIQNDLYSTSAVTALQYQKPYFFGVRAYAYNANPSDGVTKVRFGGFAKIVGVRPVKKPADLEYSVEMGTNITSKVDRSKSGGSDGVVRAVVIDPLALIDANYRVYFSTLAADKPHTGFKSNNGVIPAGTLVWNLERTYNGTTETLLKDMPEIQDGQDGLGYTKIIDGIRFSVTGAPLDFKDFQVTANASGALSTPAGASASWESFPGLGENANTANQQSNSDAIWLISTWSGKGSSTDRGPYSVFKSRTTQYTGGSSANRNAFSDILVPDDFEFRFTGNGKGFFSWSTSRVVRDIPFEVWNLGDDKTDPADDFQLFPMIYDFNDDDQFNVVINPKDPSDGERDHELSGASNDPWTDAIYVLSPKPGNRTAGSAWYNRVVNDFTANPDAYAWHSSDDTDGKDYMALLHRMTFVNWNGGSVTDATFPANLNAQLPETGTIFKIITTKPNHGATEFSLQSPGESKLFDNNVAKKNLDVINFYPNPYFGGHNQEESTKRGFFTNLPRTCQITIYNLAGELVKTINKNSTSSSAEWFFNNDSGNSIASGVYFAVVKLPTGENKVLKLAVLVGRNQPYIY